MLERVFRIYYSGKTAVESSSDGDSKRLQNLRATFVCNE